jgi:N-acetylneuraminate lyase
MTFRLRGLIAAPHTPMRPDGGINFAAVQQQSAVLVAGGVAAAFVCGTTGEGASLTSAERMRLVERWVEVAPPPLAVIAHVGHTSVAEARVLAGHAQSAGAKAISALAPYFFKPRGVS